MGIGRARRSPEEPLGTRLGQDPTGSALLGARLRRGLTQEQLADAVVRTAAEAGIELTLSASAVSRWESGRFRPAARYRPHLHRVLTNTGTDDRSVPSATATGRSRQEEIR